MNTEVVVSGRILDDGTLVLDEPHGLPPCRVTVLLRQELKDLVPEGDPFFETLKAIWARQKAAGVPMRTEEDVQARIRDIEESWGTRQDEIERLQAEGRVRRAATQEGAS